MQWDVRVGQELDLSSTPQYTLLQLCGGNGCSRAMVMVVERCSGRGPGFREHGRQDLRRRHAPVTAAAAPQCTPADSGGGEPQRRAVADMPAHRCGGVLRVMSCLLQVGVFG